MPTTDTPFTTTDAYSCTKDELVEFLQVCGFRSAPISEYADKVLKTAHFTALHSGDTLCGLCITYMNRPAQKTAYVTYIAIKPEFRHLGGVKH